MAKAFHTFLLSFQISRILPRFWAELLIKQNTEWILALPFSVEMPFSSRSLSQSFCSAVPTVTSCSDWGAPSGFCLLISPKNWVSKSKIAKDKNHVLPGRLTSQSNRVCWVLRRGKGEGQKRRFINLYLLVISLYILTSWVPLSLHLPLFVTLPRKWKLILPYFTHLLLTLSTVRCPGSTSEVPNFALQSNFPEIAQLTWSLGAIALLVVANPLSCCAFRLLHTWLSVLVCDQAFWRKTAPIFHTI